MCYILVISLHLKKGVCCVIRGFCTRLFLHSELQYHIECTYQTHQPTREGHPGCQLDSCSVVMVNDSEARAVA
jgi:hypothetical protein